MLTALPLPALPDVPTAEDPVVQDPDVVVLNAALLATLSSSTSFLMISSHCSTPLSIKHVPTTRSGYIIASVA